MTSRSKKQIFLEDLRHLEAEFNAQDPELQVVVRDATLGVEGYIVVWNTAIAADNPLGPFGKGGTRITPTMSLGETRNLARTMALKNAAAGLPLGGSKSGLRADPNAPGFEKVYRRFVQLCAPYLRERGGIFGGFGFDIGASDILPIWACDELGTLNCFTGKPIHMGGTDYDNEGIAGLGVAVAAKTAIECNKDSVSSSTYGVQGLGAMGAAVVRYFSEFGGKLIALSDPQIGGAYRLSKPAPQLLIDAIAKRDFESIKVQLSDLKAEKLPLEEILYQAVDVLFPSAVQNVITAENVHRLRIKYLIEGANLPTTPEAQTVLFERGVTVIPDFVANPGGIIAAYIELTSKVTPEENTKTRAKVVEAKEYTKSRIQSNVQDILAFAQDVGVEPRQAALSIALKKILGKS